MRERATARPEQEKAPDPEERKSRPQDTAKPTENGSSFGGTSGYSVGPGGEAAAPSSPWRPMDPSVDQSPGLTDLAVRSRPYVVPFRNAPGIREETENLAYCAPFAVLPDSLGTYPGGTALQSSSSRAKLEKPQMAKDSTPALCGAQGLQIGYQSLTLWRESP